MARYIGGMMLLGWESNTCTCIWQKSVKLEGGNLSLGMGNPRFTTLCMKHWLHAICLVKYCNTHSIYGRASIAWGGKPEFIKCPQTLSQFSVLHATVILCLTWEWAWRQGQIPGYTRLYKHCKWLCMYPWPWKGHFLAVSKMSAKCIQKGFSLPTLRI